MSRRLTRSFMFNQSLSMFGCCRSGELVYFVLFRTQFPLPPSWTACRGSTWQVSWAEPLGGGQEDSLQGVVRGQ